MGYAQHRLVNGTVGVEKLSTNEFRHFCRRMASRSPIIDQGQLHRPNMLNRNSMVSVWHGISPHFLGPYLYSPPSVIFKFCKTQLYCSYVATVTKTIFDQITLYCHQIYQMMRRKQCVSKWLYRRVMVHTTKAPVGAHKARN
jgi:hypothetical protein